MVVNYRQGKKASGGERVGPSRESTGLSPTAAERERKKGKEEEKAMPRARPGKGMDRVGVPMHDRPRSDAVPGDDPWQATSVVRTLWPPQPGTLRWRESFGDNLVCVRYRHDLRAAHRYTTVEILVDHAPIRAMRSGSLHAWELKARHVDARLRGALRKAGAEWDPKARAWRLSLTMARQLGVADRIARKGKPLKTKGKRR